MADTTLSAYRHLTIAQVRSQTQYRASFAADVIGSLLFGGLDVASVVVLFRVTPTLGGFGFAEVFLMTALAGCAFALADLSVGNVERLRQYVRSGLFDALLVRPLSSLAQLMVMDVATRRVGRSLTSEGREVALSRRSHAAARGGVVRISGRQAS